jgi:septin family protein
VTLQLNLIDTPGFGDQLNREDGFKPILEYIDTRFDDYDNQELQHIQPSSIRDNRVHCILYFVSPHSRVLKQTDVTFLKMLSTRCNVIPVIGKSDALNYGERDQLRTNVRKQLDMFDIKVYPMAHCEDREELADVEQYVPFFVVGANTHDHVEGQAMPVRRYAWGQVDIENLKHSDVSLLRKLILQYVSFCKSVYKY